MERLTKLTNLRQDQSRETEKRDCPSEHINIRMRKRYNQRCKRDSNNLMPKTENLCEMVKFLEKYPKLPKRTEEKYFMNIPLTFNDCLKISPQIKYQSQVFAYRLANIQETSNFNLI